MDKRVDEALRVAVKRLKDIDPNYHLYSGERPASKDYYRLWYAVKLQTKRTRA